MKLKLRSLAGKKIDSCFEKIEEITEEQVESAICKVKNGKAPGVGNVTGEMLKYVGLVVVQHFCDLMSGRGHIDVCYTTNYWEN